MGAPHRLPPDVEDRLRAWADDWQAVAGSTEPADRRRAEAALTALYRAEGLRAPEFLWVQSPRAGLMAYAFAARSRKPVLGAHVRGDVGTGDNRDFNALVAPFGLEPAWANRVEAAVAREVRRVRPGLPPGEPSAVAAEGLGVAGTGWLAGFLEAHVAPDLPRDDDREFRAEIRAVAGALMGEGWPALTRLAGVALPPEIVAGAIRQTVADLVTSPLRQARRAMQAAQWDGRIPVLAARSAVFGAHPWRPETGRAERERAIQLRVELARSLGAWWALEGLAICTERPLVVRRDDRGRPHAADGPALAWGDGVELFAWHGVGVPRSLILDPGSLTLADIDGEANVEVRRAMIERFGVERLVREGGAQLVHEDATGRLWSREVRGPRWSRDEPVVMVEVLNSTPEPDGSRKTYFLRVPPDMRRAREAVAWTFGLGADDYRPLAET